MQDELVPNATTLVLGQAPGATEEYEGKPFVGATGELQTERFFPLARLERGKVHIANVLKCRWVDKGRKTDKLPQGPVLDQAVEHCTKAHLRIPAGTTLVVAEGGIAASWCAGTPIKVHRWRGHLLWPTRRELDGLDVRGEASVSQSIQIKDEGAQSREGCSTEAQVLHEGERQAGQTRVLESVSTNSQTSKTIQADLEPSSSNAHRTEQSVCSLSTGAEASNRPRSHNNGGSGTSLQSVQPVSGMVGGVNPDSRSSNQIYSGRGLQVYVVEHLAAVLRDPKSFWISELDWRKIPRINNGWPQVIPKRLIASPSNWPLVLEWFKTAARRAKRIAIDTEFVGRPFGPHCPLLTIIGLGYLDEQGRAHGIQIQTSEAQDWMRSSFYNQLQQLVAVCPVVFQNFAADMPVLRRCAGIEYKDYLKTYDTMLGHAIQYCELPHSLEFLASKYGWYAKLKHLGDDSLTQDEKWAGLHWLVERDRLEYSEGETPDLLYNWGDVLETMVIDMHLEKSFDMDQPAREVYESQSLKLIPHLLKSMDRGLRVNKPRVMRAKEDYEKRCKEATLLAETYIGRPINLGSDDQLKYYCYRERDYPIQVKSDEKGKRPTVDEDAVAVLRDVVGPAVDTRVPLTLEVALQRIELGADPVLEARVLYQEAQHALDSYIYGLCKSVYFELHEGRKKKARERVKREGFTLEDLVDRVYPNYAIHAQKNARWSTTEPPLAQLPGDLRDIIIPDVGECWPHWDWKGIELHFLELLSKSKILKQAHEDGIDLHTWTMCKMFGYEMPPNLKDPYKDDVNKAWREKYTMQGSGDPRRVFAKSARYEMNYGGVGDTAADKAIRMGLPPTMVKQALANLLTADVDYFKWRQDIEKQVKTTRTLRTFTGRPRRFLTVSKDHSHTVPQKVIREALDYPMQAGVSDVFNLTVIALAEKYPDITFAWGMHDAQYWHCANERVTPEFIQDMKDIATREYVIAGQRKRFPLDFDIIHEGGSNETH